jgi:hypothetical protein
MTGVGVEGRESLWFHVEGWTAPLKGVVFPDSDMVVSRGRYNE